MSEKSQSQHANSSCYRGSGVISAPVDNKAFMHAGHCRGFFFVPFPKYFSS